MEGSGLLKSFIEINNDNYEHKDNRVISAANAMELYIKKSLFGELMIKDIDLKKINSILLAEVSKLDFNKRIEGLKKTQFIGTFYDKLDMLLFCSSLLQLGVWKDGIVIKILLERIPNAMKERGVFKDFKNIDKLKIYAKELDELKQKMFQTISPASSLCQERILKCSPRILFNTITFIFIHSTTSYYKKTLSNISFVESHDSYNDYLSSNTKVNRDKELSINAINQNAMEKLQKDKINLTDVNLRNNVSMLKKDGKLTKSDVLASSNESLDLSDTLEFDNAFIPRQVNNEKRQITKELLIIDAGTDIKLANNYLEPTQ